ncbi:MAG: YicC family protein [Gammaproteobacteria bacterium]|nr:YicC family protein [Gammaproteobacteria bacterium]
MLSSMTAYQRETETGAWGNATIELKTVNHRFLDINLRLPEDLRPLEPLFRDAIQKFLNRGKVDCSLRIELDDTNIDNLDLNEELARKLIETAHSLSIKDPDEINPIDILKWPGVVAKTKLDLETLTKPVSLLLEKTLKLLVESRQREGNDIKNTLLSRCKLMETEVKNVRQRMPEIINALRDKYQDKVKELVETPDNDRLEQEILHLIQKMDVEEELDRLDIHLAEMKRVLDLDEPVGRRLDFLMQEMNREANTLASKSANIDTSNSSIELKVLIEQMREQIQNIE